MAKKPTSKLSVETLKHDEATRKNIPTAEFQSVMVKNQPEWEISGELSADYADGRRLKTAEKYLRKSADEMLKDEWQARLTRSRRLTNPSPPRPSSNTSPYSSPAPSTTTRIPPNSTNSAASPCSRRT